MPILQIRHNRFFFFLRFGSIRKSLGISNLRKDGKYFLMFDIDTKEPTVLEALNTYVKDLYPHVLVEDKCRVIYRTEHGYHAYFPRIVFDDFRSCMADILGFHQSDLGWVTNSLRRHYCFLEWKGSENDKQKLASHSSQIILMGVDRTDQI